MGIHIAGGDRTHRPAEPRLSDRAVLLTDGQILVSAVASIHTSGCGHRGQARLLRLLLNIDESKAANTTQKVCAPGMEANMECGTLGVLSLTEESTTTGTTKVTFLFLVKGHTAE